MTNKIIIIGVIGILVVGLVFLGLEMRNLRAEVSKLSADPGTFLQPHPQTVVPKFTRPNDPRLSLGHRWDPYAELSRIQNQMNRLFNESFTGGLFHGGLPAGHTYALSSDIKDSRNKYVINMDIPGMEKENINVEVKNNTLLVSGERNNENEEKNANYYKQERSFGYFSQAFQLPEDADASGISVNYNKGVLKIEISKLAKANPQEQESTKIKVN